MSLPNLQLKALNSKITNDGWGDKPPKRIKILNWGKTETTDGNVILNNTTAELFDIQQKHTGRDEDVALDFDHCTVPGSKEYEKGKPKSIAAYGDPVLVKGDGLYLDNLKWTELGEKNRKNYMDLSPAVTVTEDGVVTGLHSCALTANGAVYKLKFYNAGFEDMIKYLTTNSENESLVFKDAEGEYNKNGANAGVNKTGDNKYEINENLSADDDDDDDNDKDEYDDHDVECKCPSCMAASDPAVHKKHLEEYDSEDHFSKYGDVAYADKENHKYPIDTKAHAKAAWSYINMPKNAKKYSGDKLSTIKSRISSAAKKFGITIGDDKTKQTKTMSANNFPIPDAYRAQPWYYNTMNDTITKMTPEKASKVKALAVDAGLIKDGDSKTEEVLFAFLAEALGVMTEPSELINRKDNTEDGGLKQFTAKFEAMQKEIDALKTQNEKDIKENDKKIRDNMIKQASKDGKLINLSAKYVYTVPMDVLEDVITNAPKGIVPNKSTLKILNTDNNNENKKVTSDDIKQRMLDDIAKLNNK